MLTVLQYQEATAFGDVDRQRLQRLAVLLLSSTRSIPIRIFHQLLECLGDGERLICPHARPGERRHTTDRGQALRLRLQDHQVERLFAMTARAASHQEGSGDALEFTGGDIGARVVLHALDCAL